MECTWTTRRPPIIQRKIDMKISDCKFYNHGGKNQPVDLLLSRGYLGITAFRFIVQDPRTQNIPLILETPNFGQPKEVWGKEIGILQTLAGNPEANKFEEDLQEEVKSVVKEAKLKEVKHIHPLVERIGKWIRKSSIYGCKRPPYGFSSTSYHRYITLCNKQKLQQICR